MIAKSAEVLIVTSAHWSGDPRLNRHLEYLRRQDISGRLATFEAETRLGRLGRALSEIWTVRPGVVVLPDPELFVLGSLIARVRGARAVIDIHENYGEAVASRSWIPFWATPLARFLAMVNNRLGRLLASQTVVAASELADESSITVANIPDPSSFVPRTDGDASVVVYVGDVTEARGANEIAELARELPGLKFLVIGRVDDSLREQMRETAGPDAKLSIVGRLPHDEAWSLASGALAGLSLLRPMPAYQKAVATKLWEYCAAGIPPVVSDLPGQRAFVDQIDPALVVSEVGSARVALQRLTEDRKWASEVSVRARGIAENAWNESRPDLELVRAVSPDR